MRRPGRRLTQEERALWAKVAQTVEPLRKRGNSPRHGEGDQPQAGGGGAPAEAILPAPVKSPTPSTARAASGSPPPHPARAGEDRRPLDRSTLDAGWDRRLAKGAVMPDFTLDLHGATLDAAHARLDQGLTLALAQGARVVLLITGRARPVDAADRGSQRGAIRRKFTDWLANGSHASKIAAIRPAHPRHGGAGAVYIVLRRMR